MTREEAIAILRNQHRWTGEPEKINEVRAENKALEMAIKALEQEPCEDCVSRQAVLDAIAANCIWENEYNLTSSRIEKAVEGLPSVDPQPKTGYWTLIGYSGLRHTNLKVCECSNCHKRTYGSLDFCGRCGADMRGEK